MGFENIAFTILILLLIQESGTCCNRFISNQIAHLRTQSGNGSQEEEVLSFTKLVLPKQKPEGTKPEIKPGNTTLQTQNSSTFNLSRSFLNLETYLASFYKNAMAKGWCAATNRKKRGLLNAIFVEDEGPLIEYKLFTSSMYASRGKGDGGRFVHLNVSDFLKLGFDPKAPFYIITHGWCGESDEGAEAPVFKIGPEFLKYLPSVNVLNVYWGHWSDQEYSRAAKNVELVALYLAKTLEFISEELYGGSEKEFQNVHLIGFSLGAHVMGRASYHFKKRMEETKEITFLTALDPAGPSFDSKSSSSNPGLLQSHATYVDVIHTGKTLFGTDKNRGAVDFWPNGGYAQPGCNAFFVCDHKLAINFYMNTINPANKKRYPFIKCQTWVFRIQECIDLYKGKECKRLYMGAYTWELLLDTGIDDPQLYFGNYVEYTDNPKMNMTAKNVPSDKCSKYVPSYSKNKYNPIW